MRQASLVIGRIHKKHKAFYSNSVGKGALKALQTDFPFPWLYVAELLQNAVDAKAKTIRLETDRKLGELTFEHDGEGFNEAQVKALCSKGISTKGARAVGFMGIGFKSVFHSYQRVDVSSGEWRFFLEVPVVIGRRYGDRQRIWLGSVLPKEDSGIRPPSPGMRCRFVLRDRLDKKSSPDDDISEIVSGDHDVLLPLLASRGVKRLEVGAVRWRLGKGKSISAGDQVSRRIVDARNEATGVVTRWIIVSAGYCPSKQAIARFLEHRQVDLDDHNLSPAERRKLRSDAESERVVDLLCSLGAGRIPLPPVQPHLHALLKTEMYSPIGLDMQADWLLVTTRRELIDPTNAWHQEIFAQVPRLLEAFLEWACSIPKLRDEHLPAIYGVLPDLSGIQSTPVSRIIWNAQLQKSLRSALRNARLLPVRVKGAVSFLSPRQASLLPKPFCALDDAALRPWEIFGSRIISGVLLGERGLSCLHHLQLLGELRPDELVSFWQDGTVGKWVSGLKKQGVDALMKLLACLAELDKSEDWRNAELRCLPPESGDVWLHRRIAKCLPKDWHAVPDKSPDIREWMGPFLPSKEETVAWWLDRKLMAVADPVSYIDGVDREVLDDITTRWWASLPANPGNDGIKRVIEFTDWVRTKQRSRMSLVKKVLCGSITDLVLVPWREAALADPYAISARRRFFPDRRFVSNQYLYHDPSASAADWQSFFEAISSEVAGKFVMHRTQVELSHTQLEQALPGYEPPDTRATSMGPDPTWGGTAFSEFGYLLLDYHLPPGLRSSLEDGVTDESSADIAAWLQEGVRDLLFYRERAIVYVPRNLSRPERLDVPFSPAWVQQIRKVKWVWSQEGSGPHTHSELLPVFDAARPGVAVARLPPDLISTLEECGIAFGTDIPKISDLARLKSEGPEASADRICKLIEAADAATSHDPNLRRDFLDILNDTPLFSVPSYIALIDQARRIPAARLVLNTSRGDVGRWLLSVDKLRSGSAEQRLATLITRILITPEKPTHSQGLSFLGWIWQTGPDADLVRRVLPQAYALLHEGITEGSFCPVSVDEVVRRARVFTSTRQWVEVSGDNVYLDDIGDARLRQVVASHGVELATGGHLGATVGDQIRTANHLKLPLLSSRFTLKPHSESRSRASQSWEEGFRSIQEYILQRASQEDEEAGTDTVARITSLFRCGRLSLVAIENGRRLKAWDTLAACIGNEAIVSGEPEDFMAELCTQLLEAYDLSLRRYVHSLGPEVTQLIGRLGQPEMLSRLMAQFRARYSLQSSASSSAPMLATSRTSDADTQPSSHAGATAEPGAHGPSNNAGVEGLVATTAAGTHDPASGDVRGKRSVVESLSGSVQDSAKERESPQQEGATTWSEDRAAAHLRSMIAKSLFARVAPSEDELEHAQESENLGPSEFGTDEEFRSAVLAFETKNGRFPVARDETQPGFDIDSFTHAEGNPNRRLLRRIEVKGRGAEWRHSEIVELSSRQFGDAQGRVVGGDVPLADDFDYWLYVVEPDTTETGYRVVAIRNPARLVAKYLFRGDLWRHLAEED